MADVPDRPSPPSAEPGTGDSANVRSPAQPRPADARPWSADEMQRAAPYPMPQPSQEEIDRAAGRAPEAPPAAAEGGRVEEGGCPETEDTGEPGRPVL